MSEKRTTDSEPREGPRDRTRVFSRRNVLGTAGGLGLAALAGCGGGGQSGAGSDGSDGSDGGSTQETTTGGSTTPTETFEPRSVKFQLEWIPGEDHVGFMVAKDQGLWAKRGLSVQLNRGFGSGNTVKQVSANQAEFGLAGLGPVFSGISQGLDLVEKALVYPNDGYGIMSHPDSGIEEPADLENTKAVIAQGAPLTLVKTLFSTLDLDLSTVDYEVRGFAEPNVLVEGQAEWMPQPLGDIIPLARQDFYPGLHNWFNEHVDLLSTSILVKSSYAEENPEAVRRFIEGAMEGWQYVLNNGESGIREGVDALFRFFPQLVAGEVPEGVDAKENVTQNARMVMGTFVDDALAEHGFGYFPEDEAQRTVDSFNQHYLEDSSVTLDQVFDLGYVESGAYPIDVESLRPQVEEVAGIANPYL